MPDPPADLEERLRRIVASFRTATSYRLRAACDGRFATRVDAGRTLADELAVAAQGIEADGAASAPVWRRLPVLPDLAVGDQIAVTAHDYLAAVSWVNDPGQLVWTPAGQTTLDALKGRVAALVADVGSLW